MSYITGYKCQLCGKERGVHQASGLYCPVASSTPRASIFHKTNKYQEDHSKPVRSSKPPIVITEREL